MVCLHERLLRDLRTCRQRVQAVNVWATRVEEPDSAGGLSVLLCVVLAEAVADGRSWIEGEYAPFMAPSPQGVVEWKRRRRLVSGGFACSATIKDG